MTRLEQMPARHFAADSVIHLDQIPLAHPGDFPVEQNHRHGDLAQRRTHDGVASAGDEYQTIDTLLRQREDTAPDVQRRRSSCTE